MDKGKKGQKGSGGKIPEKSVYHLKLYIAGDEANSLKAIETVKETCEKYLGQNYRLEIIDVFQNYRAALEDRILVAPTLLWVKKGTPAFLIGTFDRQKLLEFLGISEGAGGEK